MRLSFKLILLALVCLLFVGCRFRSASQSVEVTDNLSTISGTVVHYEHTPGATIVVLLLKVDDETGKVSAVKAWEGLDAPGKFRFYAMPGNYSVLAFEDLNGDYDYQVDEYVGWQSGTLRVSPASDYPDLQFSLQRGQDAKAHLPAIYQDAPDTLASEYTEFAYGEITTWDNPHFDDDYGQLGMWNPYLFFRRVKTGIFFLEPYDPNKIPVLFVHGVAGHPGHWENVAASLDKTKYQAWFIYYPSFFRLKMINEFVAKFVTSMHKKYKFNTMYVVAHSMGGLVARGTINQLANEGGADYIKLFVSISSPWGGHEMAEMGVSHSPVVLPVWFDVKPNSLYLMGMHGTSLPRDTRYALFFTHKGGLGIMARDSSDGTITLRSQLDPRVQDIADYMRGFDENHRDILNSEDMMKHLQLAFDGVEQ